MIHRFTWKFGAGAGGQEAALFVADLQKMYTNYAQTKIGAFP